MNKLVSVLMVSAVVLSGCAPRVGGNDYSARSVGEISRSCAGTIIGVRSVNINSQSVNQDGKMGAGAALGGVGGAVLGSQIGGGRGRAVTGVLGALAGGVAGHMIERNVGNQQGFEYRIRLDNGNVINITQGVEPAMGVGQRVNVIEGFKGDGRSRVVPL